MSNADDPSWHDASDRANFVPYEPVGDGIEAVWAGGFGGAPGSAGRLEVCAFSRGTEITVETVALPLHPDPNVRLSLLVHELIGSYTLAHSEMTLPYSVTVESDERPISVSGHTVMFSGARIDESPHWIGEAIVDDVLIRVTVHAPIDFELRPCPDPTALSSHPPRND